MLVLIACDWHASGSTYGRKVMESDLFTPSITVNKKDDSMYTAWSYDTPGCFSTVTLHYKGV